jgi:hypothetical protein
MNATRWQLTGALSGLGRPVHTWSGGCTKWNRSAMGLAKTHTLDALSVGQLDHESGDAIARFPGQVLVAKAAGPRERRCDRAFPGTGARRQGSWARLLCTYHPGPIRLPSSAAVSRQAALRIHHRGSRTSQHADGQVDGHLDWTHLGPSERAAQPHHTDRPVQRPSPKPAPPATGRRIRVLLPVRRSSVNISENRLSGV